MLAAVYTGKQGRTGEHLPTAYLSLTAGQIPIGILDEEVVFKIYLRAELLCPANWTQNGAEKHETDKVELIHQSGAGGTIWTRFWDLLLNGFRGHREPQSFSERGWKTAELMYSAWSMTKQK